MTHPQNSTEDRMTVELPGCTEVDHDIEPGSPEWQTYMSGSKVSAVLGINPWTTRLGLWRQMTGRDASWVDNAYTAHGRDREPVIREGTERDHGCTIVTPRMLISNANPRHAYSPDGIIPPLGFTPARLWECKTATERSAAKWDDGIPKYYEVQWQWGAYVTGLQHGLFTLETHEDFLPLSTQDYPIVRDDTMIEWLIDEVDDFLLYVSCDEPPPPLGAVVVTDPYDVDTIRRWAKDNAQRLDVEKHIKAARPLIDRLGENAQALMTEDGEVLCHWTGGEPKDVDVTDWAAIEDALTDAQRPLVSQVLVSKELVAAKLPDLVAKHTTTESRPSARSLKMGARR